MSEVLVEVDHVSKRFCRNLKQSLWYGVKDIGAGLCGLPTGGSDLRLGEFWAINDVSFELRRGECLGLIGANGAGKSTLLKMLNGLIKPDAGSIRMRGRLGALIELGAGFHPLLSGRENIYVNASVLGMRKREIDRRLEEIIAFADIGDAIDAPVKSYSSGMRVRLGFAVAAHLEPDVLLIDEVLAVGDINFRSKCYSRINALKQQGTSIILVSHQASMLLLAAHRGILLDRGTNVVDDSIITCLDAYEQQQSLRRAPLIATPNSRFDPNDAVTISQCWIESPLYTPTVACIERQPISLCIAVRVESLVSKISMNCVIRADGEYPLSLNFRSAEDGNTFELLPGLHTLRLNVIESFLRPGEYICKISISDGDPLNVLAALDNMAFCVIRCEPKSIMSMMSTYYQPHNWTHATHPLSVTTVSHTPGQTIMKQASTKG